MTKRRVRHVSQQSCGLAVRHGYAPIQRQVSDRTGPHLGAAPVRVEVRPRVSAIGGAACAAARRYRESNDFILVGAKFAFKV